MNPQSLSPPPGTRDYVACNLCGRPVNMQKFASQMAEAYAKNPGLQAAQGNMLQPIPPCDVCQGRMMASMSQAGNSPQ